MVHTSDSVCEIKLGEAIRALIIVLSSKDGSLRQTARRSLTSIGRPSVPALIDILSTGNSNQQWEAAKALSEIADPRSASALVKALENEIFGVRWLAAEGLIAMGMAGLKPLLEELAEHPDSTWLREGAHHVLRGLFDQGNYDLAGPVLAALQHAQPSSDLIFAIHCTLGRIEKQ